MIRTLAYLALFSGIAWLARRLIQESRSETGAVAAAIRELGLTRDDTVEASNGGYPCTELLQRYRGRVDGAEVFLLKVLVGSGRRSNLWWLAGARLARALEAEFRISVERDVARQRGAPLPRLAPGAVAHCDQPGWVASWVETLPETTVAAVNRLLAHDRTASVTHREVYRAIALHDGQAENVSAALREMAALARLLSAPLVEAKPFTIHTSFHFVRYQEGDDSFELTIDPGLTGSSVYIPTPASWPKEVPAWAAGRRDEIVARLRAHLSEEFEFVES